MLPSHLKGRKQVWEAMLKISQPGGGQAEPDARI